MGFGAAIASWQVVGDGLAVGRVVAVGVGMWTLVCDGEALGVGVVVGPGLVTTAAVAIATRQSTRPSTPNRRHRLGSSNALCGSWTRIGRLLSSLLAMNVGPTSG